MEKQDIKTPDERLKHIDQILDEYESKVGLSKFQEATSENSDVNKYLAMQRGQIEQLDIEECAEAALILNSFAFHVQRSLNRENSRVGWADAALKEIVFGRELQYSGSWDSQFYQAVKNDDYAKKLLSIKNYAQRRADRLTFLSSSIKSVADMYVNLQRAKAIK
jgi:hypothetical protein